MYSQKVSALVGKEVSLIPNNIRQFLTNPMKELDPPMYDLNLNEWLNKTPGDKWNYYMVRVGMECCKIERDSDDGMKIMEIKRK